jgi:hypothetical protein
MLEIALIKRDSHQCINRAKQVPGKDLDQASYHREVSGIYRPLLLAQMVCKIYDKETGHVVVACDNESAGQKKLTIGITNQSLPKIILACSTQSISSANYFPSQWISGKSSSPRQKVWI